MQPQSPADVGAYVHVGSSKALAGDVRMRLHRPFQLPDRAVIAAMAEEKFLLGQGFETGTMVGNGLLDRAGGEKQPAVVIGQFFRLRCQEIGRASCRERVF